MEPVRGARRRHGRALCPRRRQTVVIEAVEGLPPGPPMTSDLSTGPYFPTEGPGLPDLRRTAGRAGRYEVPRTTVP
ncbi:hypothetical protein AQJ91_47100 [Streptomyces dysideae]|uniref:Uncharacterized protein n=1 Tax=Streptomyces dysideae TaxID=909626 RepID=A0A101UPI2_9ACTN|nr:hypothetical protein AQJ91_47100 [Streptomyces dysideae]